MRRMAVILGLVWGVATLAPWWAGRSLEAEYEARLAELPSSPFLDVRVERYERGWFSSQAVTVIEPVLDAAASDSLDPSDPFDSLEPPDVSDPSEAQTTRLVLHHQIAHGPYPLAWLSADGFDGSPVLAHVDTRATVELEGPDVVEEIELPLTLAGRFARDGSSRFRLRPDVDSDEFTDPELDADWDGTYAELGLAPEAERVDGELQVPRIEFDGEAGRLRVAGLHYTFGYDRVGEALAQPLYVGGSRFRLGLLQVEAGGRVFELRDLEFEDTSDLDDGAWSFQVDTSLGGWSDDGRDFGPAELRYRMAGIALEPLAELGALAPEFEGEPLDADLARAQLLGGLAAAWPKLMAASPELEVSRLRVATADGEIRMSLRVGVDSAQAALLQHPLMTLPALEVDAQLALPEPLVNAWLQSAPAELAALDASPPGAPGWPGLAAVANARQAFEEWLDRGLIARGDGRYTVSVRMRQGALRLNGRVVSLGSL